MKLALTYELHTLIELSLINNIFKYKYVYLTTQYLMQTACNLFTCYKHRPYLIANAPTVLANLVTPGR